MTDACAVLVVEDDAGIRTVLADALGDEGFCVRSAAHGRDALAVLEHWHPDLIVTDLSMPVMDGWAFREEIRRRPQVADIPVVVLSAGRWERVRIDGLDAAAFLAKPCDLDALVATIRRVVGGESLDGSARLPV